MRKATVVLVTVGAVAGTITVLISEQQFPPVLQGPLRVWWLHFFAVLAVSVVTGLLLGCHTRPKEATRRIVLACLVPYGLLAAHELGQWLYPKGPPEDVDLFRDLAMNALGTVTALFVLWRCKPTFTAPTRPRARQQRAVDTAR